MPLRESVPWGAPCWIDLQTSDPARARDFYAQVLGWEPLPASEEFGGYFMFARDGRPVAGAMPSDEQAPVRDVWSVYLAVEDADATTAAVTAAGGQVVVPPMPIADMGRMGFVLDAAGAGVGLWEPGTFPGFVDLGEPGAPSWFELYTRDHAAAVPFYREAFGWQRTIAMSDTDEFRYTVFAGESEHDQYAGVMDAATWLPGGVPPHWVVYYGAEDVDATVATAERLGATVLEQAVDTPYGRLAHLADLMGATFKLIGTRGPA